MRLFFEVREGPNKGLKAEVSDGLQIGRALKLGSKLGVKPGPQLGMQLNDPKASALHAEVQKDGSGGLLLVDKGSSNLIKTKDGRVRKLLLEDGLDFKIGNTRIHVAQEHTVSTAEIKAASTGATSEAASSGPKEKSTDPAWREDLAKPGGQSALTRSSLSTKAPAEWRIALSDYLQNSELRTPELRNLAADTFVRAFVPPLEVEVVQGFQVGTIWTLGYGPREFGRACADLSLWDPLCSDIAFQISPKDLGEPQLRVMGEGPVKVNSQKTVLENESMPLLDGDLIAVGETVLKIKFL